MGFLIPDPPLKRLDRIKMDIHAMGEILDERIPEYVRSLAESISDVCKAEVLTLTGGDNVYQNISQTLSRERVVFPFLSTKINYLKIILNRLIDGLKFWDRWLIELERLYDLVRELESITYELEKRGKAKVKAGEINRAIKGVEERIFEFKREAVRILGRWVVEETFEKVHSEVGQRRAIELLHSIRRKRREIRDEISDNIKDVEEILSDLKRELIS